MSPDRSGRSRNVHSKPAAESGRQSFQPERDSLPRSPMSFDTVRRLVRPLPGVEEGTAYGSPAFKVRGRLLACIPTNRSAEPDSIAVRIDFDKRAVLTAAAPELFYFTEHYRDHPIVLVRLSRIGLDELRNLLQLAWQFVSAQGPARPRAAQVRTRKRRR